MAVFKIVSNATNAKILNADRPTKLLVSDMLSYEVDGAAYAIKAGGGGWSGTSSFFKFKDSSFPAGFVHYVKTSLEKKGHVIRHIRKPLPSINGTVNPKVDEFPEDDRYDYQQETVNRLLVRGRMIAQIATGGGKSRVAKLAYRTINRPTLFLTTRGVLMHQMKRAFEDMGEKVGVIGDGEFKPSRGINVGMVQTFISMLKNPKPGMSGVKKSNHLKRQAMARKLLEMFEFVILEEAHEISGNGYYDILKSCKNANYRLALTATPFMKDSEEANMRLMASVGSIGIRVSEKMLIDRGILAKPIFKFIATDRPKRLFKTTPWQKAYKAGIVENSNRNAVIISEVERAVRYGMPVMVLVQHKAHGEILKKGLISSGIPVEFIYGKHEQKERQNALNRLASGKTSVLIGSTILDVGVDVPALGMVILAGGGKAEVALRQRIGRGLRAKKSGPNVAYIIDFSDLHNKHLRKHSIARRAIIEGTRGFSENVVEKDADFDFGGFSLVN